MRDIEELLREAPLVAVPSRLNERLERAFAAAAERKRIWFFRTVPVWASVAASLVAAVVGFGAHAWLWPPKQAPVVYILPVSEPLRQALMGESGPPDPSGQLTPQEWRVSVRDKHESF